MARNAKLYGMERSLNIKDPQYNVGLSIFFVSYAVFEVRPFKFDFIHF
jgi:hypothetical protein